MANLKDMDSLPLTDTELAERIESLTDAEQENFKMLVSILARCYGKRAELHGMVLIAGEDPDLFSTLMLNCGAMEGATLLQAAAEFFEEVNTYNAPPKEMFN
tara:strand:- start:135 stop:440 length:306 start_codon:yes stop_codon:yes gene_type:complete